MGAGFGFLLLCYKVCGEFDTSAKNEKFRETRGILRRNFRVMTEEYRALEISCMYFCRYWGCTLVPSQVILIHGMVCANYTLLRHERELNLVDSCLIF